MNQNQFQDVWTPVAQRPKPGSGTPRYVISAWSGGGYDPNTGDFYVWGGDNGTYTGNEMYRWTASSLSWERLSLPSANTYTYTATGKKMWTTVDGVDNSPISGETFDNVVFLPGVNRLAIIGGNAYPGGGLQYFREDRLTRAGPYFFDPSKGDAEKVGGITGSQVAPAVFPGVVGGNMWENRQSIHTEAGIVGARYLQGGATAATTIDGKDVVFVSEQGKGGAKLFKYTVNSLDPAEDQWEVVGVTGKTTYSGTGVGAYDSTRNIFVRTAKRTYLAYDETTDAYVKKTTGSLMYWDLNNSGSTNVRIPIPAISIIGDDLPSTSTFGMDYDPLTDAYYLWAGTNEVWVLKPPTEIGPEGWAVERLLPEPVGPTWASTTLPMIYGKWNYMEGLGAFMGVVHSITGDVWIYKPLLSDLALSKADVMALTQSAPPVADSDSYLAWYGQSERNRVPEPAMLALLAIALGFLAITSKIGSRERVLSRLNRVPQFFGRVVAVALAWIATPAFALPLSTFTQGYEFVAPAQSLWGSGGGFSFGTAGSKGLPNLNVSWDVGASTGTVSAKLNGSLVVDYSPSYKERGLANLTVSFDGEENSGLIASELGAWAEVGVTVGPLAANLLDISYDLRPRTSFTPNLGAAFVAEDDLVLHGVGVNIGIFSTGANFGVEQENAFRLNALKGSLAYKSRSSDRVYIEPFTLTGEGDVLLNANLVRQGYWDFWLTNIVLDNSFSSDFDAQIVVYEEHIDGVEWCSKVFWGVRLSWPCGLSYDQNEFELLSVDIFNGTPFSLDFNGVGNSAMFSIYVVPEPSTESLLAVVLLVVLMTSIWRGGAFGASRR